MFRKMIVIAAMAMLAMSAQAGTASAGLVANGGFETGDFTGWTLTNVTADDFVMVIGDSVDPSTTAHSGNSEALLGKTGAVGTISQDIATTSGMTYNVTYWVANDMPGTNSFQALWNGSLIQAVAANTDAFGYTQYSYQGVAAGDISTIAFSFQNDPSTFHVDDVDATPTPIPAAAWLLGSGLMGLVGVRRKKQ